MNLKAQRYGLSANTLSPVVSRQRLVFVPSVLVVLNVSFAPMYSQISQLASMPLTKQLTSSRPPFPMQTKARFCLALNSSM